MEDAQAVSKNEDILAEGKKNFMPAVNVTFSENGTLLDDASPKNGYSSVITMRNSTNLENAPLSPQCNKIKLVEKDKAN